MTSTHPAKHRSFPGFLPLIGASFAVLVASGAAAQPRSAPRMAIDPAVVGRVRINPSLLTEGTVRALEVDRDSSTISPGQATTLTAENAAEVLPNTALLIRHLDRDAEAMALPDEKIREAFDVPLPSAAAVEVYRLPFQILQPRSPASDPGPELLRPIIAVVQPLQYDERGRTFRGELALGVEGETNPERRVVLPVGIHLAIAANGVRNVTPRTVVLNRSATFESITLDDPAPDDPATVRVLVGGDRKSGSEITVPVRRPRLTITANPSRILGFGLETTTVTVRAEGLGSAEGISLSLGTPSGRFEPGTVVLDASGSARAELRSARFGPNPITATGGPFGTVNAVVDFVAPWTFLLASILGGALGGGLTRAGRSRFGVAATTGVGIGLLSAVLYSVGVNVLPIQPAATVGEALVFAIAGLAGALGPRILPGVGTTNEP